MFHRLVLAVALGIGIGVSGDPGSVILAADDDAYSWIWIGPPGPFPIQSLTVAPDWPAEKWIEVTRDDGVLRTTDGGATWEHVASSSATSAMTQPVQTVKGVDAPKGSQVQVGEHTYEAQKLFDSPSTDVDETSYAVVHDPCQDVAGPTSSGRMCLYDTVLLVSHDRGSSWQLATSLGTWGGTSSQSLSVTFSPRFSEDGRVFALAEETSLLRGSSQRGSCSLLLSTDRGDSFKKSISGMDDCRFTLQPTGQSFVAFFRSFALGGGTFESVTFNGGESWQSLSLPNDTQGANPRQDRQGNTEGLPRAVGGDGTVFIGNGFGGVIAFGPGTGAAGSEIACPVAALGGFERVWRLSIWARNRLGCATEPEHGVSIRLRQEPATSGTTEPARDYWLDDDSTEWLQVDQFHWSTQSKSEKPWLEAPSATIEGSVQRFEGGMMIFLPNADSRSILVLADPDKRWKELPDTP